MSKQIDKTNRLNSVYRHLYSIGKVQSKSDFAKKIGYGRANTSSALNGDERYLTDNFFSLVASAFNEIDLDWLLTGKGSMLVSIDGAMPIQNTNNSTDKSEAQEAENQSSELRPRIPIEVAAGSLAVIAENGVSRQDCEMFPKIGQFPSYDFTTFVRGDSMEPKFERGAEIACKRVNGSGFIQWGRVHVLDTSQGAVIKQIYDEEDSIRCKSFNPIYPDFLVPKEEIYSINLVVGKLTFE